MFPEVCTVLLYKHPYVVYLFRAPMAYDYQSIAPSYNNNTKPVFSDDDSTASVSDLGKHSSSGDIGSSRTKWYGTSLVLLSDVMGTGILGLPFVAVTLGWATTMIAIPLFAIFAAYSGHQLKTVKIAHPGISSYAEAGREFVGPRFGTFTKACMLLNWSSLGIYFLIATADGIEAVYDQGFLNCNLNRTIIAAILLVVPAQSRDFHTISEYLSLPSTLAIIVTIVIIIVTLVENLKEDDDSTASSSSFGENTIVGVQQGTDIFTFLQSLSSIVFAFQGQSIFMELMSEMKRPSEFTKSSNLAYAIMGFLYAIIVVIAYGIEGENVEDFLPASVSPGRVKTTIGVLILFHITVAYVLAVQPFHFWVHSIAFPKTFNSASTKGQLHWLLVTGGCIVCACVIANVIPFFSDLQGLIGSLLGAPIVFGWPSLYYLLMNKKESGGSWTETFKSIGFVNSSVSMIFLCILTPLFCVLGTWGGIVGIIDDLHSSGSPFHC